MEYYSAIKEIILLFSTCNNMDQSWGHYASETKETEKDKCFMILFTYGMGKKFSWKKIRFAVIRDRVCREEELENNGQILQISHYKTIKY